MADVIEKEIIKIKKFVYRAEYIKALQYANYVLKKFPNNFKLKVNYASILGDAAEMLSPVKRAEQKKKSIEIMRKLLSEARWHQKSRELYVLKNEYYWQTAQHFKQYQLGVREVRASNSSGGYYSQGVGAAWHAYFLAKRGQLKRAIYWAKISINAWKNYNKHVPQYYNQYVHWALAYGILNQQKQMMSMLKMAAKLSKKSLNYREFQEIIEFVNNLR